MKGTSVGHYRIGPRLGSGGMGVVYQAEDTRLGRSVAIKFLPENLAANRPAMARFHREARTASSLNHPNICTIHDTGEDTGRPYIVMELLEGTPLSHQLHKSPLPTREVLKIARDLADGLKAAHEAGLVHRDIKPSNLFLTRHGHTKILDFGLAKTFEAETELTEADTALTRKNTFLGTVAYASPELVSGDTVDQRSDLFSLGIVLYELATGHHPFKRDSKNETALALMSSSAEPVGKRNPDIPATLAQIIGKLLERNPEDRFQSADQLLSTLDEVEIAPQAPRLKTAFPAAVLLLLGFLAIFFFWPDSPPQKIAVLPFIYEGPAELRHLADNSVPTALTDALRSIEALEVAPFVATSRVAYQDNVSAAAQKLKADWIVQGELKATDPEYVAKLSLFDTSLSKHVWTQEFQGNTGEYWQEVPYMAGRLTDFLGIDQSTPSGIDDNREREAMRFYLEGQRYLPAWDVEEHALHAERAFRQAIAINDRLAEAHAGLALALTERWRQTRDPVLLGQALEEADQAVLLKPSLPGAHLARASVYLEKQEPRKAEAAALRALDLAPGNHTVVRKVAQAYAHLGKNGQAKEMFGRTIEMEPDDWENYHQLGRFYWRRSEYEKAKESFRKVIDLRPESDVGYSNLGGIHILLGEFKEAQPLLLAALKIQPNDAGHNNLGVAYYFTDQFTKAAAQFQEAVIRNPENSEAWLGLGDAYRQADQKEKALEAYGQAIEKSRAQLQAAPEDPWVRTILAASLAGSGRCSEAQKEIDQIATSASLHPYLHYQCAVALSLCGEARAAKKHVDAANQGDLAAYIEASPDLKTAQAN